MYVLRKHLGRVRKAARCATERGGAGETPIQKFLKISLNFVMIEVKESILGDEIFVKPLKSICRELPELGCLARKDSIAFLTESG